MIYISKNSKKYSEKLRVTTMLQKKRKGISETPGFENFGVNVIRVLLN